MPAKKKQEIEPIDIIEPFSDDENDDKHVEVKIPDPPPPPPPEPIPIKKKKGRTMTPGALEQLKRAREQALVNKKKMMEERAINTPIDNTQPKTKNNPSNFDVMNQKFELLTDKFNQFLDDKNKRRAEKRDLKKKYQDELPGKVNKSLLEDELKQRELAAFRKRMFGF